MAFTQRLEIQPISTRRFHALATFLETEPSKAEILLRVHTFLDEWQAFRSRRLSASALAAVDQVIRDMGWTVPETAQNTTRQPTKIGGDPGAETP